MFYLLYFIIRFKKTRKQCLKNKVNIDKNETNYLQQKQKIWLVKDPQINIFLLITSSFFNSINIHINFLKMIL